MLKFGFIYGFADLQLCNLLNVATRLEIKRPKFVPKT